MFVSIKKRLKGGIICWWLCLSRNCLRQSSREIFNQTSLNWITMSLV